MHAQVLHEMDVSRSNLRTNILQALCATPPFTMPKATKAMKAMKKATAPTPKMKAMKSRKDILFSNKRRNAIANPSGARRPSLANPSGARLRRAVLDPHHHSEAKQTTIIIHIVVVVGFVSVWWCGSGRAATRPAHRKQTQI